MPGIPGPVNVHFDLPLTNFALKYDILEYVGYRVAPAVSVMHESDRYYIFGQSRDSLNVPNAKRAIGDMSNEIKFQQTDDAYSCDEYALRYALADRVRDNADDIMRLRQRGTQQCIDQLNLAKERRLQPLFQSFGAAPLVPGANVATKWDAGTTADPESDIKSAMGIIRRAIGRDPNTILMTQDVADALVAHFKSTLSNVDIAAKLTFVDLPNVLWGLNVIIAKSIYNTANAGQTPSIADIWNDNVTVFYMDPSPSIDVMSFVYTFQARPYLTKTWRDEARNVENIEVSVVETEKMVAREAAYVLGDTLT